MVVRLWVAERIWQNSLVNWFVRVWLQQSVSFALLLILVGELGKGAGRIPDTTTMTKWFYPRCQKSYHRDNWLVAAKRS